MPSPAQRLLDAHLANLLNRLRLIRALDLSRPEERVKAQVEALELIRAVTRYRGLLKNAAEGGAKRQAGASHTAAAARPSSRSVSSR